MKLIDLSLILILAYSSNGQSWKITLNRTITTELGSNVTIWCMFTVPPEHQTNNFQVYWKKPEKSKIETASKDKNAFVFHPNDSLVLQKYRRRTKLIGDKTKGDCSLKMFNIRENEPNIYMRVIAKGDNYSFKNYFVSISVPGAAPVTLNSDDIILSPTLETTMVTTQVTSAHTTYMAIFIPVVALLIIISVTGIVFCLKHKRSQSFTRQESGYYANFSRASSNQAKRDACHEKQENKKLSEVKVIDEPVYINTEAPASWMAHRMDCRMDHTENVYGNVDYSK